MDDRTEIRSAVEYAESQLGAQPNADDEWRIVAEVAREHLALLDSDALIIRRDKDGEWPADVIGRVGPILEPHPSWSDPLHYRASLVVLREATVRKLDALASSQGVDP